MMGGYLRDMDNLKGAPVHRPNIQTKLHNSIVKRIDVISTRTPHYCSIPRSVGEYQDGDGGVCLSDGFPGESPQTWDLQSRIWPVLANAFG